MEVTVTVDSINVDHQQFVLVINVEIDLPARGTRPRPSMRLRTATSKAVGGLGQSQVSDSVEDMIVLTGLIGRDRSDHTHEESTDNLGVLHLY